MRKFTFNLCNRFTLTVRVAFAALLLLINVANTAAQCNLVDNTIAGIVFVDEDDNGAFADGLESGLDNVMVTAFDSDGNIAGFDVTNSDGEYSISQLQNGTSYRVSFTYVDDLQPAFQGADNKSANQYVVAPTCNTSFGLADKLGPCTSNPDIVLSCFAVGGIQENAMVETLVAVEHDFNNASTPRKIATHGETGAVWGIAYKPTTKTVFSSSFVKFNSELKGSPYQVYQTVLNDNGTTTTSPYVNLSTLVDPTLTGLTETDFTNCAYGAQVGRVGLGNLEISPDGATLYSTVLDQNLLVIYPSEGAEKSNTTVVQIDKPSDLANDREFRIFALELADDKIYIGGTATAASTRLEEDSKIYIIEVDLATRTQSVVFTTNYNKNFWQDIRPNSTLVQHWLTDLSMTDDGDFVINLTDRKGHTFCDATRNHRLDDQKPDVLYVFFDSATNSYQLENNGVAGGIAGSGVGNNQGPGGGEFFGQDHFPVDSSYHNEVAIGSSFILEGSGEIIVSAFDPGANLYSGGLQRYDLETGKVVDWIELYNLDLDVNFGKAAGFGDIDVVCDLKPIEIGNYVWSDANGNGTQDAGEEGLAGIQLNLYDAECNLLGSTTTDADGHYSFNAAVLGVPIISDQTYFITLDDQYFDDYTSGYTVNNVEYGVCTVNASGAASDTDCDIAYNSNSCLDVPTIEVSTSETNHTFDIALAPPAGFDLALKKEIVGDQFARVGEEMTFLITVYNQGGVTATSVKLADYLPAGFDFDPNANPDWTLADDVLTYTITETMRPGEEVSRLLKLTPNRNATGSLVNYAEIAEARDLAGDIAEDIDSTADSDAGNDAGGEPGTDNDNEILDDGSVDEDDHDPAYPKIFDLAVKIELADTKYYYGGQTVRFDVTVYNQGDVDSDNFKLVNYNPTALEFDAGLSSDWTVENGQICLTNTDVFEAGAQRQYAIYYNVKEGFTEGDLINYVEIARSSPVDDPRSFDFDSTPDAENGDLGGKVNTNTDNEVNDRGLTDEDDHDPVLVRTRFVDLALTKKADVSRVDLGGTVVFDIEVFNQGTAPVTEVTITDYLPEGLAVIDQNWEVNGSMATRTIDIPNGLLGGDSFITQLRTNVSTATNRRTFLNIAEISDVVGEGENLSDLDIDSKPDQLYDNDLGGVVNSVLDNNVTASALQDEDDHDPALVALLADVDVTPECLGNAALDRDGMFRDEIVLTSLCGEAWEITSVSNYYSGDSDDDPDNPILLDVGPVDLEETDLGNGMCTYSFEAIRFENMVGEITFENNLDETVSYTSPAESYAPSTGTGANAVCAEGVFTYAFDNPQALPYSWLLPDGGAFASAKESFSVDVDWTGVAPGQYQVVGFQEGCFAPLVINVTVGSEVGSMACHGNLNVSLADDCELEITPELVISGTPVPDAAYGIMATDAHGDVIPNGIVTNEHVNTTVTVKLMDACSGNSCWSFLYIEDKLRPTIECEDAIVACNDLENYAGPVAMDNCTDDPTITLLNREFQATSCDPDFIAQEVRTYQATDEQGNISSTCTMTVMVERLDTNLIIFPMHFQGADALSCATFETDANGNPSPSVTGVPTYLGESVFPTANALCNTASQYTDQVVDFNGKVKIMRQWEVYEAWCTEWNAVRFLQFIELKDVVDPEITCPDDITISATGGDCEGTVMLPLATATDDCSDVILFDIQTPNGLIKDGESRLITLPFSLTPYTITYIAKDEADNMDNCSINVTVVDDVAPVAICHQNKVVSLTNQGIGYVYAANIDNFSYDACGVDSIRVRRMDNIGGCNGMATDVFSDRVFFCCDDVGQENMVELRVWDKGGRFNSCMANVIVQDKQAPILTVPADMTIECTDEILPLSQFGAASATDACGVVVTQDSVITLTQCGTGTIQRIFTASDNNGSTTKTQTITVESNIKFGINDLIRWPDDLDTMGVCNEDVLTPDLLPAQYAYPEFNIPDCSLVGADFTDEPYEFGGQDNTCYKIVRRWKIIDWCQMNDPNYQPLEHTQIIKVTNLVAPEVTINDIDTVFTADCNVGPFTASASATDDCTPLTELSWVIGIDLDQNGTTTDPFDFEVDGMGANATISTNLPLGDHRIVWSFFDACGNATSRIQEFTVANTTKPEIACLNGVSVGLSAMDLDNDGTLDTEMAFLCADSLVASAGHPCGTPFEISFAPNEIVKKDSVDCNDIGIVPFTVYAIDAFGNFTSCVVDVEVQDNNTDTVCINVKDCITLIESATFEANEDCEVEIDDTMLDVIMANNDCGVISATHDYGNAPSNTTLEGAIFTPGTYTIVWQIMDDEGRMATCSQEITVTDITPPTIECPNAIVIATGADGTDDCEYTFSTNATPNASDNCGIVSTVHNYAPAPNESDLNGATFPLGITMVTYTTTDVTGLTASCEFMIRVMDVTNPTIECADSDTLDDSDDGMTDCQYTVDGDDFDPVGTDDNCEVATVTHNYTSAPSPTTLEGAVFPIGTTTVVWTVTDPATNSATCEVDITVADDMPPMLDCSSGITLTTSSDNSSLTDCIVTYPNTDLDPTATDCGTVTFTHDFTPSASNTTLQGAEFSLGENIVTWTATDGVNSSTCQFTVTVEDDEGPICNTQDTIFISIPDGNPVELSAMLLDPGFIDPCGGPIDVTFAPGQVDCSNVGDTLLIDLTGEDQFGNETECDVVLVVMEVGMALCDPIDITVNLDNTGAVTITPNMVNNAGSSACGNMPSVTIAPSIFFCNNLGVNQVEITAIQGTDTLVCISNVTVVDTLFGPVVTCEDDITVTCEEIDDNFAGDINAYLETIPMIADITDNCPPMTTIEDTYTIDTFIVNNVNACNYGEYTRTVVVTDSFNMTSQCTQVINFSPPAELLDQDDINSLQLPDTVVINECVDISALDPSDLTGQITLDSIDQLADCFNVSIDFEDDQSGMACNDTIVRVWTVVDSCQIDPMQPNSGEFTYTQVLIINDTSAPMMTVLGDTTIYVPMGNTSFNSDCSAFFDASGLVTATDCNDIIGSNDGPFADDNNSFDMSGVYEEGVYDITYTAADICGNETSETFTLTVIDTLDFRVGALKEVFIIDSLTEVALASSYDIGYVEGNCNGPDINIAWVRDNPDDSLRTFDCSIIPAPGGSVDIDTIVMYFYMPGDQMAFDSFRVLITIQDAFNVCPPMFTGGISGNINNRRGLGVNSYAVRLFGGDAEIMTDTEGGYVFPPMDAGGQYTVSPYNNDDPMNGVTTMDLIMIQRHLLQLSPFTDPYQIIAADINGSETITSTDLVSLRKLILGVITEFPNNTSWTTVDAAYVFPDELDPFAGNIPTNYDIESLDTDMEIDFVAIKTGDVNETHQVVGEEGTIVRNAKTLEAVQVNSKMIGLNTTTEMQTAGMQFTLNTMRNNIVNITSDYFTADEIAWNRIGEGMYNVSIAKASDASVGQEQALLYIEFDNAIENVASAMTLGTKGALSPEIYNAEQLLTEQLAISFRSAGAEVFEMVQNTPNPWSSLTSIMVVSPTSTQATFKVYDVSGRVILNRTVDLQKGQNTITLNNQEVVGAGVFFYEINDGVHSAKEKMIKLK